METEIEVEGALYSLLAWGTGHGNERGEGKRGQCSACMNIASLENTSVESGISRYGQWIMSEDEGQWRREMASDLC